MTPEKFTLYELTQFRKLKAWEKKMRHPASFIDKISGRIQRKFNSIIPEKIHQAITVVVKKMVQAVLFTSEFVRPATSMNENLQEIERSVEKRLEYYRSTAAVEGGVTGFSGIAGSFADFPLLLAIKIKFLFDVASLYGFDTSDLKERIYLLYVFQLAFSNPLHRGATFEKINNWEAVAAEMPADLKSLDWRDFQQQYRDYLDLAKMAQMIPGIGAVVGVVVNYRLLNQLSSTAMMCYRKRWLDRKAA